MRDSSSRRKLLLIAMLELFSAGQYAAAADGQRRLGDDVYSSATVQASPIDFVKAQLDLISQFQRTQDQNELRAIRNKIKLPFSCNEIETSLPMTSEAEHVLASVACNPASPPGLKKSTIGSIEYNFHTIRPLKLAWKLELRYVVRFSRLALGAYVNLTTFSSSSCPDVASLGDALEPGYALFFVDRPPFAPIVEPTPIRYTDLRLAPVNGEAAVLHLVDLVLQGKVECEINLSADSIK